MREKLNLIIGKLKGAADILELLQPISHKADIAFYRQIVKELEEIEEQDNGYFKQMFGGKVIRPDGTICAQNTTTESCSKLDTE